MSTLVHGDPSGPGPQGSPRFDVAITGDGRGATLTIPPSSPDDVTDDALLRGALDALLSAGVVHGLERALVAAAVTARDGQPHVVARATSPSAPVDGHLDLHFPAGDALDPLHTLPAGTLLARCTPPSPGSDGVAVTGEPLPAAAPASPAVTAGEGAEESVVGEGVTVIRSLVDGHARIADGVVHVDPVVRVPLLRHSPTALRVFGSLEVAAGLPDGARISVSGDLRVAGDVERAELESGGDIRISGSCVGSEIHAGALASAHRSLLVTLADADGDIVSAAVMAAQLVASAVAGGRRLPERDALRAVLTSRFSHLPRALADAVRVLNAPGVTVEERVSGAVTTAAEAVGAATRGDLVTVESVRAAGQALSRAVLMMRSTASHTSDVEAAYLQACRVQTRGSLILTGHGTYNVDADIGGDLRAHGAGATVRGGTVRVHGMLVTTELGAPAGAPVRVVLEGVGGPRRLTADVAHPGVEISCGGREIVLESTALNLSVGFDEENRVVCSEDPLG